MNISIWYKIGFSCHLPSSLRHRHTFIVVVGVFIIERILFITFISINLNLWLWFANWTSLNGTMISHFHNGRSSCLLFSFINKWWQLLLVILKSTVKCLIHQWHIDLRFIVIVILSNLTSCSSLVSKWTFFEVRHCWRETETFLNFQLLLKVILVSCLDLLSHRSTSQFKTIILPIFFLFRNFLLNEILLCLLRNILR
jgi:hypothetical protein